MWMRDYIQNHLKVLIKSSNHSIIVCNQQMPKIEGSNMNCRFIRENYFLLLNPIF